MNMNVASTTSPAAIVSFIFGILSWVALPFIGAIVAIVCGHVARGEIRRAPGAVQGDGLAVCGLVLGYLHLFLFFALTLAFLTFFGGFAWFAAHMH